MIVVSFDDWTPPARFDSIPWEQVRIEEAATASGTWTTIDTVTLTPPDADPANPAVRDFTTPNGTDVDLWYRVIFLDGVAGESNPSAPFQNGVHSPYATVAELAALLRVSAAQKQAQLQRVIDAASYEVDQETGRTDSLSAFELQLASEVTLERAVEHWQQGQTPFGILGLGSETGPAYVSTDTWKRHAEKLSFLKQTWGVA